MNSFILGITLLFSQFTNASYTTNKPLHEQKVLLAKYDKVKEDLYYASKVSGFDMYTLTAIASAESGFNAKAVNNNVKGPKPAGMLQYMPGTWETHKKRYAKEMGISRNASVLNQRANLVIGAKGLAETKDYLIKNTKLTSSTIQPGDYYMVHFLGEGRALKVLNSKPNTSLTKFMSSKAINANYTLTRLNGKKNGRVLTTGELRKQLNRHVTNHGNVYKKAVDDYQLTMLISEVKGQKHVVSEPIKKLRMKPMDLVALN